MQPDTTLLAFDTSAAHCAAALLLHGTVHTRVEEMARGQGERLMLLLEELLAAHGLGWGDLDGLGVGTGPGNFTGIRISVSAARGLALGLGKPAVGVSMFETTQHLSGRAQTSVPAPRDQLYVYDPGTMGAPILAAPDDVTAAYASATAFPAEDHIRQVALIAAAQLHDAPPAPKPVYVKPPDAAPAREAPPVILP
ncbi:tRNA (adenosine(37)-N6)-threonylcarbamoyltransferase complex dimerization subunit type 1 TsaB [Thalassorhabdomicrobium marinisediminis]|uniref:tRNA (Adenosine(37)-N6)-threonylcarbamoyltransferase complex dimerization subunit type 1 TsaB n=1 Tax=Thalassorhabdomicrobium marinisediminis TaxID=2170577 RepID=A0A2T7FYD0_9RHOB|nr:tRNA (adenosine(37)-N6)-threonylcarbamoyltransferase complex dimerization subunit type 1 TsaB [Thalassorhabdomicrobium marinisediminis]PVA07177.1 tRNA (adenosine(37)-N6)-threonylcarbamoyltransferase complex dimerization subunit type 1 TsaB [Thalassorhabdomicrobium marinisediminis]